MPIFLDVDPRILHVPSSRLAGADAAKLARQLAKQGVSTNGMPRLWVIRGKDGEMQIFDGATRATRVAKYLPGQTVPIEIIDDVPNLDLSGIPTIGDLLP
jgi:hypothetical protein